MRLSAADASDCLLAIEERIVVDVGRSLYRARRASAGESLFWEGHRNKNPRAITFWMEPAITFAALARLHLNYGWPADLIANQPAKWAFDVAAHKPGRVGGYQILGEIKKTVPEADRLIQGLERAAESNSAAGLTKNVSKKWESLQAAMPDVLWVVGPDRFSAVFRCTYSTNGSTQLLRTSDNLLAYPGGQPGVSGKGLKE